MLIDGIKKIYREMTGKVELAGPVVVIPNTAPAANASRIHNAEMQSRRLRRQRAAVRHHRAGAAGDRRGQSLWPGPLGTGRQAVLACQPRSRVPFRDFEGTQRRGICPTMCEP